MGNVVYQFDPSGSAAPQTQTGIEGSADTFITGGTVGIDQSIPGNTNGMTNLPIGSVNSSPLNATTVANVASMVIKAGPGKLYGLSGYNAKASAQFIQIFDAATVPADGAIPKVVFTVGASSNYSVEWGVFGRFFATGIVICNSSTQQTKTIGSADIWVDAQYL